MGKEDLFGSRLFLYLLEKYPGKQLHFNGLDRLIILGKLNIQEDSLGGKKYYEISIATNKGESNNKKTNTIDELKELIESHPYKEKISI